MVKEKHLNIRLTPEQHKTLQSRAHQVGFSNVSSYVRSSLFLKLSVEEKISQIHDNVVNKK